MKQSKSLITKSNTQTKVAKIFMSGRSQAVRLPLEFRFSTKEVFIARIPDTGALLLAPKSLLVEWQSFFDLADNILQSEGCADFLAEYEQTLS